MNTLWLLTKAFAFPSCRKTKVSDPGWTAPHGKRVTENPGGQAPPWIINHKPQLFFYLKNKNPFIFPSFPGILPSDFWFIEEDVPQNFRNICIIFYYLQIIIKRYYHWFTQTGISTLSVILHSIHLIYSLNSTQLSCTQVNSAKKSDRLTTWKVICLSSPKPQQWPCGNEGI